MSLRLVSLFPGHLDLNGDQANLKVLQKRLQWLGHQSAIVAVNKGDEIPIDADLIFLGHGSMAAWNDIEQDLRSLVTEINARISSGAAFMAVSTGHERAIQLGVFPGTLSISERISKFEIAELGGKEVLGYLNSASNAPVIQKQGLSLGTQLHGPIFAKNPELADAYLAEILESSKRHAGNSEKSLGVIASRGNGSAQRLVDQIVDQVWELERELASE